MSWFFYGAVGPSKTDIMAKEILYCTDGICIL